MAVKRCAPYCFEGCDKAVCFIFSCNSVLIAITVLPIKVIGINTNSRQNALRIKNRGSEYEKKRMLRHNHDGILHGY